MVKTVRTLEFVETALNDWLKPKVFAESWDNVGLLVGSGKFSKDKKVITGIIVCNDLKPAVVEEAIAKNVNLVIAYHPPIFSGMKAIAYGSWKEQLIARCLAYDISVYSPHTTLDAIAGGINDGVIEALKSFGSADSPLLSKAILPSSLIETPVPGLMFTSSVENLSNLIQSLKLGNYPDVAVELDVDNKMSKANLKIFGKLNSSESQIQQIRSIAEATGIPEFKNPIVASPVPFGAGRIVTFSRPVELSQVVDAIKVGLNLEYVQLAFAGKSEVQSAAVCVGSGGSLLNGVRADVYITGEMSHHNILDSTIAGTSVILCNHCMSERHYLPKLANIVQLLTNIDQVFVSQEDVNPLSLSN